MSTIQEAIEAARQAAPVPGEQIVADPSAPSVGAVPAPVPAAGTPITMNQLMRSTIQADHWLKVNEFGLLIGKNKQMVEEVLVEIDLSEIRLGYGLRAGGNPPKYWKTYDRAYGTNGEPWTECMRQARIVDDSVREYPLADLVMTLVKDVPGKKEVLAEAGQTLAHTTSVTNWKNWANFYRSLQKAGKEEGIVTVRITAQERSGNGNTWGVLAFELVE